jgi:hypothetical protein
MLETFEGWRADMSAGHIGRMAMSFERYIGGAFLPEAFATLSEALAKAAEALDILPSQASKRELVAELIVRAALVDKSLDAAGLCRKAVADFRKSTGAR